MPNWLMINHPEFLCDMKVMSFIINCIIIYNQLSLLNVLEGLSCITVIMYNWNTLFSFYGSRKFESLPPLLRFHNIVFTV